MNVLCFDSLLSLNIFCINVFKLNISLFVFSSLWIYSTLTISSWVIWNELQRNYWRHHKVVRWVKYLVIYSMHSSEWFWRIAWYQFSCHGLQFEHTSRSNESTLNNWWYILLTMSANNYQVSSKFNASKSLMMITETTNNRSDQIYLSSHCEEQYSVILSKFTNKKLFTRKCVDIMNDIYDYRSAEHCARVAMDSWIVWNFHLDIGPKFDNDLLSLGKIFPCSKMCTMFCWKRKIHRWYSMHSYSLNHGQNWR